MFGYELQLMPTRSCDTKYPRLFSPIRVGPCQLRNRVATTAHLTATCVNGLPTDRTVAYYRERARNGVALMIIEANHVAPPSSPGGFFMEGFRDEIVPGYQRVTEVVHAEVAGLYASC